MAVILANTAAVAIHERDILVRPTPDIGGGGNPPPTTGQLWPRGDWS